MGFNPKDHCDVEKKNNNVDSYKKEKGVALTVR